MDTALPSGLAELVHQRAVEHIRIRRRKPRQRNARRGIVWHGPGSGFRIRRNKTRLSARLMAYSHGRQRKCRFQQKHRVERLVDFIRLRIYDQVLLRRRVRELNIMQRSVARGDFHYGRPCQTDFASARSV